MTTVILAFYKAFPPECGAATVTFEVFRHLKGEKKLIQLDCRSDCIEWAEGVTIQSFGPLPKNTAFKGVWLLTKIPSILMAIRKAKPDVVILEGAAWSLYNLVIFLGKKLCPIRARLIYHAHNVEYFLRKEKNSALIALISRWAEGILIKKCLSFAVSAVDAHQFEMLYGVKPGILANGVDPRRFHSVSNQDIKAVEKEYHLYHPFILFMGLIGYKPNDDAVRFLVERVMPRLILKRPDLKLVIIGGQAPYKKDWLINPGIIPYRSIPPFVRAADICAAPVFSGSGTRLKILEYMAAGKPVVTTSKGAEGLTVKDGRDLIIADTESSYSESIMRLINDHDLSRRLGLRGKRTVENNYSWEAIVGNFMEILNQT